ncbi:MAG: response regulator transcription factor [Gaiellaceae bacterium]
MVRTLGEHDAAALASVTAELAVLDDAEPFPPHFLGRLAELMGTRIACYCELDRSRERSLFDSWWEDGDGGSEVSDDDATDAEPYWRLRHQHPVCGYRERTNDWTNARAVSDFLTLREFHRTEIWNELYRDADINHWIDVGLRSNGKHTRMFLFTRGRGDFGERERLVLDLLQPHLQQRLDRVQAAAEAADALASLEECADDPRHIVLCSGDGVIEFASPESRRLLGSYLPSSNGRIPEHVLAALLHRGQPVVVERDERRLTIRAARSAGLLVMLLGEEDMRINRLTPRQRMILEHVAHGETDAQIASVIGIAASTVNKHLEQIYRRLDVHTRTAAVALLLPAAATS